MIFVQLEKDGKGELMYWIRIFTMLALGLCIGCQQSASPTASSAGSSVYRLAEQPQGADGVKHLKEVAADGDDVVVVGRIGGDTDPFVSGRAAFLIVDTSLKPCNEKEDDACETPWDYCCDLDLLPSSKLMVKVVDDEGQTVASDARELLGVKELQTVVVRGKAQRDEAGNVTVLAHGVFVHE
jgi:hypothetical protein